MAPANPDRSSYFPAIEKKHGLPMSYWFDQMKLVEGQRYPEQIAYLRENHGFSQAHANALVLYSRGSSSSRRFDTVDEYLEPLGDPRAGTIRTMFSVISQTHPDLVPVIAWNQPMLKSGAEYVIGFSAAKQHILIGPWGDDVIEHFRPRLEGYQVNKKTIRVPADWSVDPVLLRDLVAYRLAELSA
jgi:uncharacterized protein YdhG (YjbR/CyaY superfamily)